MARRIWIVCLSLALAGTSLPSLAQEGLLEDLYGRGVHAFFEHRYEESHGLLTKAITSGLEDPRAHYFRGLAYLRLGRPEEAQADFATGAELESSSAEPVNIGRALERIQGAERLKIEQQRRATRLSLRNKAEAAAKARYEERLEAEKRVLLPGRRPSGAEVKTPPATLDETDPFKEEVAKPAPLPAAPSDAKPAAPDESPPATTPPDPKPAPPAPDSEAPKAAAEAPRGSVLGSLFRAVKKGAIPAAEAAAAEQKPAVVPAGDANAPDPFADPGTAKPAPPKPAETKPAPSKPAADDPFADPK